MFGIDTNWDKIEEKQKDLRDHYAEYYATTQQVHIHVVQYHGNMHVYMYVHPTIHSIYTTLCTYMYNWHVHVLQRIPVPLLQILGNVTVDYNEMEKIHSEVLAQFVNMTSSFISVIDDMKAHAFVDVTTDVTSTSDMFASPFFDEITDASLLTKQDTVYKLAQTFAGNVSDVNGVVHGWTVIGEITNDMVANSSTVSDIFSSINLALAISSETQAVAASLLTRDVVCFIAQTHYTDLTTYDHYNLTRMLQGNCGVTDAEWLEIYDDAQTGRLTALAAVEVQV